MFAACNAFTAAFKNPVWPRFSASGLARLDPSSRSGRHPIALAFRLGSISRQMVLLWSTGVTSIGQIAERAGGTAGSTPAKLLPGSKDGYYSRSLSLLASIAATEIGR